MVEWKTIEEIGSYFGGLTGKTKEDFEDGNGKFITYMNVFANPSLNPSVVGVVKINEGEKQNKIQKGDVLFTGSSETPEETGMSCVVTNDLEGDFYMNSFCFGLRLFAPEQYNLHYLKHLLRSESVRKSIAKTASGVTRFNISKARFSKIQIPIPSLSEQTRIVEILDTFTASIENLKEQIAERRKQYEHYRDQLLDLEGKEGVEIKTLPEISINCDRERKPITSSKRISGVYPYYGASGIVDYVESYIFDGDYLLISEDGANLIARTTPIAFSISGKNWVNNHAHVLRFNNKATQKFVEIYLNMISLEPWINGAAQPKLNQENLNRIEIPILSLSEQSRIVSILDTFEASIANLEAQLKEREKQYEYYRNKLLTFE